MWLLRKCVVPVWDRGRNWSTGQLRGGRRETPWCRWAAPWSPGPPSAETGQADSGKQPIKPDAQLLTSYVARTASVRFSKTGAGEMLQTRGNWSHHDWTKKSLKRPTAFRCWTDVLNSVELFPGSYPIADLHKWKYEQRETSDWNLLKLWSDTISNALKPQLILLVLQPVRPE